MPQVYQHTLEARCALRIPDAVETSQKLLEVAPVVGARPAVTGRIDAGRAVERIDL